MKHSSVDMARATPERTPVPPEERREQHAWRSAEPGADAILPERDQLASLLGLEKLDAVKTVLDRALLHPIGESAANRGKRFRGQLVTFSYRLLNGDMPSSLRAAKNCRLAAEAIEFIHSGSLIIDDIEDGSAMRRGRPALHLRYPMPIALNAGNWLYFWPFEIFQNLALPEPQRLHIYESCHRTLLRAHFGQAIDLGAEIDTLAQPAVAEVCMASMRLKTGALMGFAALLGGAVAARPNACLSILDDFGRDLGVGLQMFDDLGNVIGRCEPVKRYEDLMLSRPSWVWATAAANSTAAEYQEFLAAVRRLPDSTDLEGWLDDHGVIERTRESAKQYLDLSFNVLTKRLAAAGERWSLRAFNELRDLGEDIAVAYG